MFFQLFLLAMVPGLLVSGGASDLGRLRIASRTASGDGVAGSPDAPPPAPPRFPHVGLGSVVSPGDPLGGPVVGPFPVGGPGALLPPAAPSFSPHVAYLTVVAPVVSPLVSPVCGRDFLPPRDPFLLASRAADGYPFSIPGQERGAGYTSSVATGPIGVGRPTDGAPGISRPLLPSSAPQGVGMSSGAGGRVPGVCSEDLKKFVDVKARCFYSLYGSGSAPLAIPVVGGSKGRAGGRRVKGKGGTVGAGGVASGRASRGALPIGVTVAETTIIDSLQTELAAHLTAARGVAGVMVVDIRDGGVLAAVARNEDGSLGGDLLTNPIFPAASIFKLVSAMAMGSGRAASPSGNFPLALPGGCDGAGTNPRRRFVKDPPGWLAIGGSVPPPGDYGVEPSVGMGGGLTMGVGEALALSCNNYFRRATPRYIKRDSLLSWARRLGWGGGGYLNSDFLTRRSPMDEPYLGGGGESRARSLGDVAAGFGRIHFSAAHGAWLMSTLANGGVDRRLRIYRTTPGGVGGRVMGEGEASWLLGQLRDSVFMGTSGDTYLRNFRFNPLAGQVMGKTGTLKMFNRGEVASLYVGLYPADKPEVAVSSFVLLGGGYPGRAKHLAAEALLEYARLTGRVGEVAPPLVVNPGVFTGPGDSVWGMP